MTATTIKKNSIVVALDTLRPNVFCPTLNIKQGQSYRVKGAYPTTLRVKGQPDKILKSRFRLATEAEADAFKLGELKARVEKLEKKILADTAPEPMEAVTTGGAVVNANRRHVRVGDIESGVYFDLEKDASKEQKEHLARFVGREVTITQRIEVVK